MKKSVVFSFILLLVIAMVAFFSTPTAEAKPGCQCGIIMVYSGCDNCSGSCIGDNGTYPFTTSGIGGAKVPVVNGSYCVCVSNPGGGQTSVTVNNNTVPAYCNNGAICNCGITNKKK